MARKRVIVLSGVSGTGKTHARTTDPELQVLPHLDIADIYREFPGMDWYMALHALLKQMRALLKEHEAIASRCGTGAGARDPLETGSCGAKLSGRDPDRVVV